MKSFLRGCVPLAGLVALWWAVVALAHPPAFLLPGPAAVLAAAWHGRIMLATATATTAAETLAGLAIGTALGAGFAILLALLPRLARWIMPLLLLSQAVPAFALAPLLVLWFGFGIASKVVMAVLIIFFPITAALADGLRRTDPVLLDLARTMNASRTATLWHVRLPAARPAFGQGLRIAASIAPIGAVIGEWIGASNGLGYVMLSANARIQTPTMLAALLVLASMTIALYLATDALMTRWTGTPQTPPG